MPRNKVLVGSFIASFALNATFLALVANSSLFQRAHATNDLRAEQIEIYKPPEPEKPQPTPKVTQPPIRHTPPVHPVVKSPAPIPKPPAVHPPTPHLSSHPPAPHPPAARPAPAVRPAISSGPHTQAGPSKPRSAVFVRPAQPSHPTPRPAQTRPSQPHAAVSQPIAHPTLNLGSRSSQGAISTPATPPNAPVVHPAPAPQPAVAPQPSAETSQRPSAPAEDKPHTHAAMEDRAVPEPDGGDWPELTMPSDVDMSSLSSSTIEITFLVDKTGRPKRIHVKRSSGNSEADNQAFDAVQQMRFKPAVQNGEPQEVEQTHIFQIGN